MKLRMRGATPPNLSQTFRDCVIKLTLPSYEGWNFNSGNYLFTTDTK